MEQVVKIWSFRKYKVEVSLPDRALSKCWGKISYDHHSINAVSTTAVVRPRSLPTADDKWIRVERS